ncbi:MAG: MSHA biogenesis protein MshE, partial [Gammaproteobacteria bacterium]|nr:MSHA biogenesis protein MshE [Gammaproteobacteria bacterium]
IAQRLVRRVCESCIEAQPVSEHQLAWLMAAIGERAETLQLQRGAGCPHCNNTGYRGRIGVYELLEIDGDMVDALRRGDSSAFSRAALAHPGFRPLALCALDYAERGITTLDEVFRIAGELDEAADDAAGPARAARPH